MCVRACTCMTSGCKRAVKSSSSSLCWMCMNTCVPRFQCFLPVLRSWGTRCRWSLRVAGYYDSNAPQTPFEKQDATGCVVRNRYISELQTLPHLNAHTHRCVPPHHTLKSLTLNYKSDWKNAKYWVKNFIFERCCFSAAVLVRPQCKRWNETQRFL